MYNLEGNVTIVKTNAETDSVACQTFKNIVGKRTTLDALVAKSSPLTSARRIALSTTGTSETIDGYSNSTPTYLAQNLNDIIAVGFYEGDNSTSYPGVTGFTYNSNPNRCRYHYRFPFLGIPRVFKTVGVVTASPNNNLGNVTYPMYAYVTIDDNGITQEANEIIDIFYEITVNWSSTSTIAANFKESFEKFLFGQGSFPTFAYFQVLNALGKSDYQAKLDAGGRLLGENIGSYWTDLTENIDSDLLKYTYTGNLDSKYPYKGQYITGFLFGDSNSYYDGWDYFSSIAGVQNIFSHSENSTLLHYDANQLATSSLKPIFTLDTPGATEDDTGLPTMWAAVIQDSGGVGVGTYRLFKRPCFGTITVHRNGPQWLSSVPTYGYWDGTQEHNTYGIFNMYCFRRYDDEHQIINYLNTGVFVKYHVLERTLVDLWDVDPTGTTNKDIFFSSIRITPDGNYIYLCSSTHGFYEINLTVAASPVITKLSSLPTFAVSVIPDGTKVVTNHNNGEGFQIFSPGDYGGASHSVSAVTTNELDTTCVACEFYNDLTGVAIRNQAQVETNMKAPTILSLSGLTGNSVYNTFGKKVYPRPYYVDLNAQTSQLISGANKINAIGENSLGVIFNYNRHNDAWSNGAYRSNLFHTHSLFLFAPATGVHRIFGFTYLGSGGNPRYNGYGHFMHQQGLSTTIDSNFLNEGIKAGLNGDRDGAYNRYQSYYPHNTYLRLGPYDLARIGNPNKCLIRPSDSYDWVLERGSHLIRKVNENDGSFYLTTNGDGLKWLHGYASTYYPNREYYSGINNEDDYERDGRYLQNPDLQYLIWGSGNISKNFGFGISLFGTVYLVSCVGMSNLQCQGKEYFGDSYGWDGAHWVYGHPDGRPIHTTTESAFDGVSIRWQELNPNNPQPVVAKQFYNVFIGRGVYNDLYRGNMPIKFAYYFRDKIEFNIPGGTTTSQNLFPIDDELLWKVDYTDADVHELYLDGVRASVTFGNTPPTSSGIITIVPETGEMKVHADEYGKTLTGTILYLRVFHTSEKPEQ